MKLHCFLVKEYLQDRYLGLQDAVPAADGALGGESPGQEAMKS